MPTLYLVATPIGNLEDITLRAIRVLAEVKLIAAEDTRRTRILLSKYGINTRLTSYYERNKRSKIPYLLQCLQEHDVALVSEAGMPGVNDPGYELVVACIERDVQVAPVPGPSAPITALAVSGLPTGHFVYLGFPPRQAGPRRRFLESVAPYPFTLIFLEAPHRLQESFADMEKCLGDRRVAVCRELTKVHEEIFRGTLSQARARFSAPRGEFTLVVAGREVERPLPGVDIREALQRLKAQGLSAREAVAGVSEETGLRKKELYREWLKIPAK